MGAIQESERTRERTLLQVSQLPVPLQDVLHIGVHDPDDLLHLGLLLGHLPGRLDLSDLSRAGDGFAIRTQWPGGSFLAWGGHDEGLCRSPCFLSPEHQSITIHQREREAST